MLTSVSISRWRFFFVVLEVRMWRLKALLRFTLPLAVFLNRFAAPLCVFSFGIMSPRSRRTASFYLNTRVALPPNRRLGCRPLKRTLAWHPLRPTTRVVGYFIPSLRDWRLAPSISAMDRGRSTFRSIGHARLPAAHPSILQTDDRDCASASPGVPGEAVAAWPAARGPRLAALALRAFALAVPLAEPGSGAACCLPDGPGIPRSLYRPNL